MSRTVILMYHRVAAVVPDPYGIAVSPTHFAEHVAHLVALDCVVPLQEVHRPSPALRVAITFDDGYRDNATTAAPLLAEHGLPATFFITTGRLGGQRFWWDRLGHALLGDHPLPDAIDVRVGRQDLWLDLHTPQARESSLRFLHRRLRPLSPDELDETVEPVLAALAAPEPPEDARSMTDAQLQVLAREPLFEIGAHTRTHLQLNRQDPRLQRAEVAGSVEDLTTALGRPITSFAFPFGSPGAVGPLGPGLATEAGCLRAVSTDRGLVTADSPRYLLPRIGVEDWDGPAFAEALAAVTR